LGLHGLPSGFATAPAPDPPRHVEPEAIRVAGNEAAYLFTLTINLGDSRTRIAPIGAMTFDDDAKITSMRAFWSPADLITL
jgi:steroid delta-isomerase